MQIATLIAEGGLDDRLVERALGLLRELDPAAAFLDWIDEGDAADISFSGDSRAGRWALGEVEGLDVVIHPAGPRLKRLLVADMDSTIIGQECIDELADYAGVKDQVADITERAMQGELDFANALRERVRLLAGLDEAVLQRCLTERVELNPGARTLVRTMRERGASCFLVTGGFSAFADPVAEMAGFDRVAANRLLLEAGKLRGKVEEPVLDARAKCDALIAARDDLGLGRDQVIAVGDGANDRLMIAEAGLGVAFGSTPALADVADAELRYHDLHALLWVQGLSRGAWAKD